MKAGFILPEKAEKHWKTYGKKEYRFASIGTNNTRHSGVVLQGLSGIYINSPAYDTIIKTIDQQTSKKCLNIFAEIQKSHEIASDTIYTTYPELIIPKGINEKKFKWYINHYKN